MTLVSDTPVYLKAIDPSKPIIKIIIAGSRDMSMSEEAVFAYLDNKLKDVLERANVVIVNGTARGIDTYGGNWATSKGLWQIIMPADWDGIGKYAGHHRNGLMSDEGHVLILFWDGKSPGSTSMLNFALINGLRVTEIIHDDTTDEVKINELSKGLDLWKY